MTVLTVGGLSFDGGMSPGDDLLEKLDGWYDGTDVAAPDVKRPVSHGSFAVPGRHGGRTVMALVSRRCSSEAEAGAARREFAALLAGGEFSDLTVTEPDGHSSSASVRLAGRTLVRWLPYSQRVQAQVQFFAPDPLRYGEAVSFDTGFAFDAGGLEFDLFTDGTADTGFLEFGALGSTGRVSLPPQDGTAPGRTQYIVAGPVPPFTITRVESGKRVQFASSVPAGAVLVIDPAAGSALLNGGEVDYSGLLTRWEWEPVMPNEPATFAFLADGPYDSGTLTVVHQAAWW